MIGLTTYRDYYAESNSRKSAKHELLAQMAYDLQELLDEQVDIVSTGYIVKKGGELDVYDKLIIFEHPTAFVSPAGNGFCTPMIDTHVSQLNKVLDFEGEVFGCNVELQDVEKWITRLRRRRVHPSSAHMNWPSEERLYAMFDNALSNSITQRLKDLRRNRTDYAVGDSHASMLWKPGRTAEAIHARTLFRTLRDGVKEVVPPTAKEVTLCFGNIDLRHHFNRQENPKQTVEDMAKEYVRQAAELDAEVYLCELLPITDPARKVTKAYFYKKEPFSGSVETRMELRRIFNDTLKRECAETAGCGVKTSPHIIEDENGMLKTSALECSPGGIHLSTDFYEISASEQKHRPENTWLSHQQ